MGLLHDTLYLQPLLSLAWLLRFLLSAINKTYTEKPVLCEYLLVYGYIGIGFIFLFVIHTYIHTYTPTPSRSPVMAQLSKRLILSYIFDWIVIMFVPAPLIHSALLIGSAQSPQLQEEFLSQPPIIDPFRHKISKSPIRITQTKSLPQS